MKTNHAYGIAVSAYFAECFRSPSIDVNKPFFDATAKYFGFNLPKSFVDDLFFFAISKRNLFDEQPVFIEVVELHPNMLRLIIDHYD